MFVSTSLAALGFVAASTLAAAAVPDPLAPYRWSARVVVASAPNASDPDLVRQRAIFSKMGDGAKARDLVLVEAVGDGSQARAIRQFLDIDPRGFTAILIGKDGGDKLRAARPLDADTLFPLIDAMPMRQGEMRARGS